jgi:multidrug efflux pump subunit AcrB
MKNLQKLLLERPIATIMFYLSLILFGVLSLKDLPIFLLPNIEFPKLTIITPFPNSSPTEVENLITKPLTEILGTVKGLDKIDSNSLEGFSYITLRFKNSENINFSILDVRERIDLIKDILPQDSEKPIITRFDPNKEPIYEIVFFSKGLNDPKNLRSFINENIKVYLDRIEGVSLVKLSGGWNKEVLIDVDPVKISSYYISILDVKDAIQKRNANYPAGQLPVGKKEVLVRAVGEYTSLEDISETIISVSEKGAPVTLKEFSTIKNTYKEQKGLARLNGEECVIAYVYKEPGKNTVQIAKNIEQELEDIKQKFNRIVKIETAYNESIFIEDSIQNLFSNLIIGALLSFISLLILLRNFYTPFILLLVIPTSLCITFLFFNLFDITVNMMSLGGLALGVGMLYDNSNVVLSGIERNLKNNQLKNAILSGVEEVNVSIFTASLTTILVFLPIVFLKSVIGLVFSEMAKANAVNLRKKLKKNVESYETIDMLKKDKKNI